MKKTVVVRVARSRVVMILSIGALTACGDKSSGSTDRSKSAPSVPVSAATAASGFRVTDAQRARLQIVTMALTSFRPTVEATGTVAFNGDRSTQVISPISGPVVRLVALLVAIKNAFSISRCPFGFAVARHRNGKIW